MKCDGKELDFQNACWTDDKTFNEESNEDEKGCAKYDSFNNLCLKRLLLLDVESGRHTILKFIGDLYMPLQWYFQQDKPFYLEYVEGCKDPLELLNGHKGANMREPAWRINGYSTGNNFKIRLGGYFAYNWQNYGNDKNGKLCTAECAGFGITD